MVCADDGFDADNGEKQGHWGLRGMTERARKLGGHMRVQSDPPSGTQIIASVPSYRAYRNHDIGIRNGRWPHMTMQVELNADRRMPSDNATNTADEIFFAIVVAVGHHRPMQHRQHNVDWLPSPSRISRCRASCMRSQRRDAAGAVSSAEREVDR
jgi:hypothetical protein